MIETNAALQFGLHMILQFTNLVHLPPEWVPDHESNLQRYLIAAPGKSLDIYLIHKSGTEFWIRHGTVVGFRTPGTYFEMQDASEGAKFVGKPNLSSNEVVALATNTINQLIKKGNPLEGLDPVVHVAPDLQGSVRPIYEIVWPSRAASYASTARIEIDARSGQVTGLFLRDKGFYDESNERRMNSQFYKPESLESAARTFQRPPGMATPATNLVVLAIGDWLRVSRKLGLDPGSQTNLADVDWQRSVEYTSRYGSKQKQVIRIRFNNGAAFEWTEGIIMDMGRSDRYYSGENEAMPKDERISFQGKIVKPWENLAAELASKLEREFGLSKKELAPFTPGPEFRPPELGSIALKRMMIEWRSWPRRNLKPGDYISVEESKLGMTAEFDLETGELESFAIADPRLLSLFGKGQK